MSARPDQKDVFSQLRKVAPKPMQDAAIGEEEEDLHTQYKMYNLTVEALLKHGVCVFVCACTDSSLHVGSMQLQLNVSDCVQIFVRGINCFCGVELR